jgi:hypothetical protein
MKPTLSLQLSALVLAAPTACGTPADQTSSSPSKDVAAIGTERPVSSEPGHGAVATAAPASEPGGEDQCNAGKAGAFVGRNADEATMAEMEATVAPVTTIRWVGPGTMTTEDYSLSRLNVMLDAGDRITSAHCG